jgi:hypothetical protein
MQQLFAPKIRRKYNVSQLITLDAHQACNSAYQDDEDYFVRTLTPFARGSEAGNAIYAKVLGDFRTGKQVPLTKMVLEEFDPNPSGLLLPGGKVVKRFQGERLRRVAWKIVRGLHFYHNNEVLPENWKSVGVQIYAGETPGRRSVLCCHHAVAGHLSRRFVGPDHRWRGLSRSRPAPVRRAQLRWQSLASLTPAEHSAEPKQQTCRDETVQRRLKFSFRLAHHGSQQRMGELAPDGGPDLCNLLGRAKAVKPRHQ